MAKRRIQSLNEYFAHSLDGDSYNSSNGVFKVNYLPYNDLSMSVGRDPDPSFEIKDSQYQIGDIVKGKVRGRKKEITGEVIETIKSQDGKFYKVRIRSPKNNKIYSLIPGSIEYVQDRGNSRNKMSVNVSSKEKSSQNLKYSGGNIIWGSFENEEEDGVPLENNKEIEGPMGTGIKIIIKDSIGSSEFPLDGFDFDENENIIKCKRISDYEELKNSIKAAECYCFFNSHEELKNEDTALKCILCVIFLEKKKELDAKKYIIRNFNTLAGTSYGEAKDDHEKNASEIIKKFSKM
jgi:hypothetical protein